MRKVEGLLLRRAAPYYEHISGTAPKWKMRLSFQAAGEAPGRHARRGAVRRKGACALAVLGQKGAGA